MVKAPAWLQGLGATGTTGLWAGRGDGEQGCHIPPPAHGVAEQGLGGRCPQPCSRAEQLRFLLYSMHIPAELAKGRAGNVLGGLCHPGEHPEPGAWAGQPPAASSSLQCRPRVPGMDVGGWTWGDEGRLGLQERLRKDDGERGCSQRRSSRSL